MFTWFICLCVAAAVAYFGIILLVCYQGESDIGEAVGLTLAFAGLSATLITIINLLIMLLTI